MRRLSAIIILYLMLFACNYTYAADEWTKIPISGGNVICMKEFPENSKILLCCTQKGGLFRSSNEGNNWIEILSGKFFDIAVAESGKVFCAGENGLFYSEDYGITFNNILPHFTSQVVCNTNGIVIADTSYKQFDYNYFFSPYLISNDFGGLWQIFKGTADTLFLKPELKRGSFLFMEDGSVLRSAGEKIYKSDGINWNNWKLIFGNSHYDTKLIKLFQFDSSKGLLYGYSKYHDYHPIEQYYGGFWQSPDTGKTWNEVINVSSVTSLERYTNEQENIDIFLIGTADGGIVTFDNKLKITETIGALGGEVTSIIASGWNTGKLFVSTKGGIYRTSDYGVTWIKSDEGIYQVEVNAAQIIEVDNHERIVAAFNNSGIWISDDDGLTWQSVNKNFFVAPGMMKKSPHNPNQLVGGGCEIFYSKDGGINWFTKIYFYVPEIYYGRYWGGDSRCLFITFNPLEIDNVFINYFERVNDLWIGPRIFSGEINDTSKLFYDIPWSRKSSWETTKFQFEKNILWKTHRFSNSCLLGIDIATGDTAKIIPTPPFSDYNSYWYIENNLCLLVIDNYFIDSPRFYISNDYGNSWEEKDINFPNPFIGTFGGTENYPGGFVKSPDGDYYLFTSGNGVYSSSDNGETWRTMNEGLSSLVALQLDFSPTNPDVIYLATDDGLYKRNVTTEVEAQNKTVTSDFIFNNYPNPFNAETKLTFKVTKEVNCKLKVFDFLGNEIETLIDRNLPAGKHSYIFNASKYSSGIYFYSLYMGNQVYTKKMIVLK